MKSGIIETNIGIACAASHDAYKEIMEPKTENEYRFIDQSTNSLTFLSSPSESNSFALLFTMRFTSSAAAALMATCVSAVPTRTTNQARDAVVQKRAAITDAADVGYATQNGGYEFTRRPFNLS